jgi:hypothetical protein
MEHAVNKNFWWGNPSGVYGEPWPIKDSTKSYKGIYLPKGGKKQRKLNNK